MVNLKKNNLKNYYLPFELTNQKQQAQNSILILENGDFFLGSNLEEISSEFREDVVRTYC